jgi:RHS repeat-associated protein
MVANKTPDRDTPLNLGWEGARWYDPTVGRWLSEDPIFPLSGSNPYEYCNNAPTDFADPTGLDDTPEAVITINPVIKPQSLWDSFFQSPPEFESYGNVIWSDVGTADSWVIGTAPILPTVPAYPSQYGDVTLAPGLGGATVPQALIKRAADLSSNYPDERLTPAQHIMKLCKMASQNRGETTDERKARVAEELEKTKPLPSVSALNGLPGESPEETRRRMIDEEFERKEWGQHWWEYYEGMEEYYGE